MTYKNLMEQFRSDTNDETTFNRYCSELQIMKWFNRAINEINSIYHKTEKEYYICLQEKVDMILLPSDFISLNSVYDIRSNRWMESTNLSDKTFKNSGTPFSYQLKQSLYSNVVRTKLFWDAVPKGNSYSEHYKFNTLGTNYLIIKGNTAGDMGDYWESNIVKLVVSGGATWEYFRINTVDLYNLTGSGGTILTDTYTFTGLLGFNDDDFIGMQITIGGNAYTVSDYDEDDGTGKSVITTTASITGTETSYTIETFRVLYFTERNITSEGQITPVLNTTLVYNVDIIINYCYEPGEYWHLSTHTITGTTTSLVTSTATADSLIRAGVGIFIMRTNTGLDMDGYMRTVITYTGTPVVWTAVIDSVFPVALTASAYYVLDMDYSPPLPQELHTLIVQLAKVYMYDRMANPSKAQEQRARYEQLRDEYDYAQALEVCTELNNQDTYTETMNGTRGLYR